MGVVVVSRKKVLVIEDERPIAEPLADALRRDGFDVHLAATAAEGLEAFRAQGPDIVLLDVMLPDGDGRDLLRQIRQASRIPVVMVSARGEEMDRVLGLELGADDYVTKPFSAAELVARMRAVLRRSVAEPVGTSGGALESGDVAMNLDTRTVTPVQVASATTTTTTARSRTTMTTIPAPRPTPAPARAMTTRATRTTTTPATAAEGTTTPVTTRTTAATPAPAAETTTSR